MRKILSLRELFHDYGKSDLEEFLNRFQCPINLEVEKFLKEKALINEKYNISRTYVVVNALEEEGSEILAYFTLTIREFLFQKEMPNAHKRRILKTGYQMHRQMASILIAQLGKNMNPNLTSMIRRTRTLIFGNAICLKSA